MTRFARMTGAALLALGAGCRGSADSASQGSMAMRTAVSERMDAYVTAALAEQTAALPDYWSEDAQIFEPGAEIHGRAAMMSMVSDFLKTMKLTKLALHTREIAMHDGGKAAYQFGDIDEVITPRDGKTAPTLVRMNFVARWRHEADGVWRMDRFVETPMPPATSTATPK